MSNIQLWQGDCLNLMKDISDKSIDLILADLPYGSTKNKWDIIIDFDEMWKQYLRIIKSKGNILLFASGIFAYKLALSNEKMFRYDMIWKKSKCGSPLTSKYMPLKKHEMILVFGNPASYYSPQMEVGKPYKRTGVNIKTNNHGFGLKSVTTNNVGTRHPSTVLDFAQKWRRQDQIHPTQKPVELLSWLINSYCPENGFVLDNVMGSGSTGIACINTGRNFIGIEKDDKYFEIAQKRINDTIIQ